MPSLGLLGGMSGASSSGGGDLRPATREGDVMTDGRGSVCVDACRKSLSSSPSDTLEEPPSDPPS